MLSGVALLDGNDITVHDFSNVTNNLTGDVQLHIELHALDV